MSTKSFTIRGRVRGVHGIALNGAEIDPNLGVEIASADGRFVVVVQIRNGRVNLCAKEGGLAVNPLVSNAIEIVPRAD